MISSDRVIAKGGKLQIPARHHAYSPKSLDTIRLPEKLTADDLDNCIMVAEHLITATGLCG